MAHPPISPFISRRKKQRQANQQRSNFNTVFSSAPNFSNYGSVQQRAAAAAAGGNSQHGFGNTTQVLRTSRDAHHRAGDPRQPASDHLLPMQVPGLETRPSQTIDDSDDATTHMQRARTELTGGGDGADGREQVVSPQYEYSSEDNYTPAFKSASNIDLEYDEPQSAHGYMFKQTGRRVRSDNTHHSLRDQAHVKSEQAPTSLTPFHAPETQTDKPQLRQVFSANHLESAMSEGEGDPDGDYARTANPDFFGRAHTVAHGYVQRDIHSPYTSADAATPLYGSREMQYVRTPSDQRKSYQGYPQNYQSFGAAAYTPHGVYIMPSIPGASQQGQDTGTDSGSGGSGGKQPFPHWRMEDDRESLHSLDSLDYRSFRKTFSPWTPRGAYLKVQETLQPGSIGGSIFTVVISMVGAGCLALPYGVKEFGLIPGTILLALSAWLSYFTLDLLLIAVNFLPPDVRPSYRSLSMVAWGPKLATFSQITICTQMFGVMTSYMVTYGGLLDLVWGVYFRGAVYVEVVVGITLFIVFPLSLLRTMGALNFTSFLGFMCSSYLATILFLEYFLLCSKHQNTPPDTSNDSLLTSSLTSAATSSLTDVSSALTTSCFWDGTFYLKPSQMFPIEHGWTSVWQGILQAFPLCTFAYGCHQNMLPIYVELQRRSRKRMKKVLRSAVSIAAVIYIVVGVFGFLTFLTGVCSNVLLNDFAHGTQVVLAAVAISVSVILTEPLMVFAFRMNLSMLIWDTKKPLKFSIHTLIGALVILTGMVIAILITDIATVFGILGCTTYPTVGYILPTIFFLRIVPTRRYKRRKIIAAIIGVTVTIASLGSLTFKIYQMIYPQNEVCNAAQTIKV